MDLAMFVFLKQIQHLFLKKNCLKTLLVFSLYSENFKCLVLIVKIPFKDGNFGLGVLLIPFVSTWRCKVGVWPKHWFSKTVELALGGSVTNGAALFRY